MISLLYKHRQLRRESKVLNPEYEDKEDGKSDQIDRSETNEAKETVVDVRVRVKVKHIYSIDVIAQQFTAEIFLEASWIDKKGELKSKDC